MAVGLAIVTVFSIPLRQGQVTGYLCRGKNRARWRHAHMASAEFSDETESAPDRSGDPFTGKLLMEACLELMAADALSIQDMGAWV